MLSRINKGYIQWIIEWFRCFMVVIDKNVLLLVACILLGVFQICVLISFLGFCYSFLQTFEENPMFLLIGVICGLAIYNSTIIDLRFPPVLYKKLLGRYAWTVCSLPLSLVFSRNPDIFCNLSLKLLFILLENQPLMTSEGSNHL